tara:strand:+ start:2947 stop:3561 length:615 start_codon:yes stop_codon:yes gene_type:complete
MENGLSEERRGLITGSPCHVLFPKRSAEKGQLTYAKLLAKERVFKYSDNATTWQMEHGHMGEVVAMEWFLENIDKKAIKPEFVKKGEFGGSGDCLTENYGVDFKCPTSLEKWLEYLTEGVSNQQYWQAQMYMFIYDRPKWKVCAYLVETNYMSDNGVTYPISPDKRCIENTIDKLDGFEEMLLEKSKFVIEKRNEFIAIYKNLL